MIRRAQSFRAGLVTAMGTQAHLHMSDKSHKQMLFLILGAKSPSSANSMLEQVLGSSVEVSHQVDHREMRLGRQRRCVKVIAWQLASGLVT